MVSERPPERIDFTAAISGATSDEERNGLAARWLMQAFDSYYSESRQFPDLAQQAFEARDPAQSLALSKRRLSIFRERIQTLGAALAEVFPQLGENEQLWASVERQYLPGIESRYEADLAFAFFNSVRRKIYQDEWKPVAYAFGVSDERTLPRRNDVYRSYPGGARVSERTVREILDIPGFAAPYQEPAEDAYLIAERVNENLGFDGRDPSVVRAIHFIDAGFFRNRGAYLVGRITVDDADNIPFVISLENDKNGIFVDAVLTSEADTHNIFSSTLANFHVTNPYYHELSDFLHTIMPNRSLGLHYSTIGFNHVGKVAVMNEIRGKRAAAGEIFDAAVGFRGTVAIGFSTPSVDYVLKVIRDQPTENYKWGMFKGIDAVLGKYRRVHEINRTGSMLDNIIYYNLKLDREWFEPPLLDELIETARETVSLVDDAVVFKHLIVQAKMVPLPVFFETASTAEAEVAIVNLGDCIKNNAAANIFNKDLDARNYGVGDFLKVYLFDYDALEPFTEVKIRTNADKIDGEEEVPDWVFEDGVVFLPEEAETGLRIPNRSLSRLFRSVHGDLLTTDYWERIQRDLLNGKVPHIRIYSGDSKLRREVDRLGTYY